jgi:ABC-type phosphate/phosphonate transport system substrate-binding protein
VTIASLAMYPFPELDDAYDHLWSAVRARMPFGAPPLDRDLPAADACRRGDLILGQTCGWPLVTELAERVQVVGTFDVDVAGAHDGTYRSVLISRQPVSLDDLLRRPQLRVAANSIDSLSGWVSLRAVASAAGVALADVEWTGAHIASVEAVRDGRADLASIDAVTWAHLGEPDDLAVVGHGPRVPCLPLVTSSSTSTDQLQRLRAALAAAVADPALADDCRTLRIKAFVVRTLSDYESLHSLAELG